MPQRCQHTHTLLFCQQYVVILRVTCGTFPDFVGACSEDRCLSQTLFCFLALKDSWMSGGCVLGVREHASASWATNVSVKHQTLDFVNKLKQTQALREPGSLAALTEGRHGRPVRAGWLVSGCLRRHWDGWLFDRAIRPASHWACLGRPETLCVYTFLSPFI